ncbi:hypothetical protein BOFE_08670 (plasmid) [Candidatus Borrelia fainii]|uniref:Lipoprotein n=1 Tax=Candidatus Borrelia fainii TaxID=2518322 RepID=A0ABM8DL56_9SPIR|nr:hypothetical protein [Candidatus Borrelia fainii]BDU63327.1 hypothetical protein BOFE_08670 [Candidatus Borrelia fainii]
MKKVGISIYIIAVATLSCKQGVSHDVVSQDGIKVVSSKTYIPINYGIPEEGTKNSKSNVNRDKAYVEFKQVIDEYKKQLEIELNKVTVNKSVDDFIKSLSKYNTQSQWNYIYTSLEHDKSIIESLKVILDKLSNIYIPIEEEPVEEDKNFFTKIFNFVLPKTNFPLSKASVDNNLYYEILADDLLSTLFNLTDCIHKILHKWSDEKNLVKIQSAKEFSKKSAQLKTIMQARNTAISKIKAQIVLAAENVDNEEKLIEELEKITEDGEANSAFKYVKSSSIRDWGVISD